MQPARFPQFEVSGTHHQIGQQIGEAARDMLHGFVEVSYQRIAATMGLARESIQRVVQGSTRCIESYAPDLLLELVGTAESSGVSLNDLMFLQIRNQLSADLDSGCTSFSFRSSDDNSRRSWIGQNWDNDPALDPFTIVLVRRPAGQPAFITVTQAGLIAYIGMNEIGIGACLNSLPAPGRPIGVPHYFTLRRIFECSRLDDAVSAVTGADRAIPANIMLSTPDGPANLEVTIDDVKVLRPERTELLLHTNHCLHPQLLPINDQFAELIQSHPRFERIHALLSHDKEDLGLEQLKNALRDHQGYPRSICRHLNEDPHHGYWKTVFSVIMSMEPGEMHLSRGNPCEQGYEIYRL